MKFAVNTPGAEAPVRLELACDRDGNYVELVGHMPDGMVFTIMSFHSDGTFVRHNGLPADSGFQLTESDRYGVGRKIKERDASDPRDMISQAGEIAIDPDYGEI